MPEIQEVFRMATQKVRPDPEALDRQHRGQRRRVAQKRAAVYALVALLLVAGAVIGISTLGNDDVQPGASGSDPTLGPVSDGAEKSVSIVDVGTGTEAALTVPASASEFAVTLDGSMVAYTDLDESGSAQIFVMNADGSNARQLTHDEPGGGSFRHASWSPDGSEIAYHRETSDGPQIFVVRVSSGVSTQVTNEPQGGVDPGGWTPDGGSILFSTFNPSVGQYSARSLDLTTGKTTQIVPDGSTPTLSPDGAWIAFNSWLKEPQVRLILANSDGSARRTIARFTLDDGYQEWSPDSTQIAYVGSSDADGSGTYVYDLATGEARFVTSRTIESWIDNDHILVS
jgi:TolB protein